MVKNRFYSSLKKIVEKRNLKKNYWKKKRKKKIKWKK